MYSKAIKQRKAIFSKMSVDIDSMNKYAVVKDKCIFQFGLRSLVDMG